MGYCKYTIEDWRKVKAELSAGGSIREVGARTGVSVTTVFRWSRSDEPPERMWLDMEIDPQPAKPGPRKSPKARLGYDDRVMIFAMHASGKTPQEIADAVGCHRTTVGRELARAGDGECKRYGVFAFVR